MMKKISGYNLFNWTLEKSAPTEFARAKLR